MKLAILATVFTVGRVFAVNPPVADVLTPSGIPRTSGLPFSTLSFDTTAVPSSVVSELSSLISSMSTAITPFTATTTSTPSPTSSTPTAPSTITSAVPTSTRTGAACSLTIRPDVAGVALVLGVVGALVY